LTFISFGGILTDNKDELCPHAVEGFLLRGGIEVGSPFNRTSLCPPPRMVNAVRLEWLGKEIK